MRLQNSCIAARVLGWWSANGKRHTAAARVGVDGAAPHLVTSLLPHPPRSGVASGCRQGLTSRDSFKPLDLLAHGLFLTSFGCYCVLRSLDWEADPLATQRTYDVLQLFLCLRTALSGFDTSES